MSFGLQSSANEMVKKRKKKRRGRGDLRVRTSMVDDKGLDVIVEL